MRTADQGRAAGPTQPMSSKPPQSDSSTASTPSKSFVDRPEADVSHSKEDALNDREFELLVEATHQLDKDYFELESRWVIFAAGRLGMRGGEIAHMEREWIDYHDEMIRIPRHVSCTKGRDGGICGYCRQAAQQMVAHNEEITQCEAEALMWSPKTKAAAREIPLNASTRGKIVMERYFDRYERFQASRTGVNRRVQRTAEMAAELDSRDVYPHALRATTASRLASKGLDVVALKQMMGWASFQTAKNYLSESGQRTEKALQRLG